MFFLITQVHQFTLYSGILCILVYPVIWYSMYTSSPCILVFQVYQFTLYSGIPSMYISSPSTFLFCFYLNLFFFGTAAVYIRNNKKVNLTKKCTLYPIKYINSCLLQYRVGSYPQFNEFSRALNINLSGPGKFMDSLCQEHF